MVNANMEIEYVMYTVLMKSILFCYVRGSQYSSGTSGKNKVLNCQARPRGGGGVVGYQYTLFRSSVIPIYLNKKLKKYFEIQEKQNTLYP